MRRRSFGLLSYGCAGCSPGRASSCYGFILGGVVASAAFISEFVLQKDQLNQSSAAGVSSLRFRLRAFAGCDSLRDNRVRIFDGLSEAVLIDVMITVPVNARQ